MAQPSIVTSRSILMHTSLAYLSPELRTFDSILRDSFDGRVRTKPASIRLPTEVLLTIRLHLLPTVTTHLFRRSTHALARYETQLRKLLCQECLSYNQEVYGPDIWGWEHFTGACSCRGMENIADESRTEYGRVLEYCDLWNPGRAFPDCSTWLELYLSFESSRLASCHQDSIQSIWDVVGLVLKDHGCRLSDRMAHPINRYCSFPFTGMKIALDIPTPIVIVPEHPGHTLDSTLPSGPIALHRADRDLGLSCAYECGLEMWKDVRSYARPHIFPDDRNPSTFASFIQSQAVDIVSTMSTAVVVAASLPITLATMALAMVCFYSSNSRALLIL